MKPRPIRRNDPRRTNPYRIPEDGPITPRLRDPKSNVQAIGFLHDFHEKDDEGMKSVYVFDIDGTIANLEHRLHLLPDWDAFFDACDGDLPIDHVIGVARALSAAHDIVYVSGRSDRVKIATEQWLERHGLPQGPIYMRRAGDHQQDDTLKIELLAELRADGYEPIMAFDDRTRVVKAWRAAGIPCAQVVDGDY